MKDVEDGGGKKAEPRVALGVLVSSAVIGCMKSEALLSWRFRNTDQKERGEMNSVLGGDLNGKDGVVHQQEAITSKPEL